MGVADLSAALWRHRDLLELLLYKLEVEHSILDRGQTRWLTHSTREVTQVLDRLRVAELDRAMEASAVALELGLDPDSELRALVVAAPAPWDDLLAQHHQACTELVREISTVASGNHRLATRSKQAVRQAISELQAQDATWA